MDIVSILLGVVMFVIVTLILGILVEEIFCQIAGIKPKEKD